MVFKSIGFLGLSLVLSLIGLPSHGAELKEIQQRGYLTVAVKDNLRPLGFRDATGQLRGLEIEIAQRIAQELLGRQEAVVFKPVTNSVRLSALLEGQVDLTIAQVTATPARSRLVDFSPPYYIDGMGMITNNPKTQQLADLTNQRVAVLDGSSTIATLRFILPGLKLVGVSSYQAGRSQLESGSVAAFAADSSVLSGWVQEAPQYRRLPVWLSAEPLCVVLPKGLQYEELRQRVNRAIARWQSEGWLSARIRYWGLPTNNLLRENAMPFDRLKEGS